MVCCRRLLPAILLGMLFLTACGTVQPVPADFDPGAYAPVDFELLLPPQSSRLHAGQLIRCQAFFWQFLDYDPGPRYYYFNQMRYPGSWGDLEWFALYKDSDMRGYFDLGAMSYAQRLEFNPKRLDPLIIYGELVPLGGSLLYLQVHRLERYVID